GGVGKRLGPVVGAGRRRSAGEADGRGRRRLVSEIYGGRRRLRSETFLRRRSPSAANGGLLFRRTNPQIAARRSRSTESLCRLQGRRGTPRSTDRDSREDDQRVRLGRGRRRA